MNGGGGAGRRWNELEIHRKGKGWATQRAAAVGHTLSRSL